MVTAMRLVVALSSVSTSLQRKECKTIQTTKSASDSPGDYQEGRNAKNQVQQELWQPWVIKKSETHSMKASNTAAGGEDVDFI